MCLDRVVQVASIGVHHKHLPVVVHIRLINDPVPRLRQVNRDNCNRDPVRDYLDAVSNPTYSSFLHSIYTNIFSHGILLPDCR